MTSSTLPKRPPVEPTALHDRAVEHLEVIRDAMERAGSFTAVPGWGTVAVGLSALCAAFLAAKAAPGDRWLQVWIAEGAVAGALSVGAMVLKARRVGISLGSAIARKFALAFAPSLAAGAVLTWSLAADGRAPLLPGTWLLLYGAAVVAGGALSARIVPLMGLTFMLLGVAALAMTPAHGDLFMAAGFGGVHLVFGTLIARRHGG